jgi:hypothetical protein
MTLVKVHSEQALAAHIFHGWRIVSVHRDPVSNGVSEHVLAWDLPESGRRPTSEEICSFVHISDIEDKFSIDGRGVVIAPGLPRDKARLLKHGDFIVLIDYGDNALLTQVRSIELSSPPSPKGWAILLPSDVRANQVLIGMQVWSRSNNQSEQGGGGNSASLRASP